MYISYNLHTLRLSKNDNDIVFFFNIISQTCELSQTLSYSSHIDISEVEKCR